MSPEFDHLTPQHRIPNTIDQGTIAKPSNEKINVIIGPRKNKIKLACVGDIYSFNNNFKASANACNRPQYPTIFMMIKFIVQIIKFIL